MCDIRDISCPDTLVSLSLKYRKAICFREYRFLKVPFFEEFRMVLLWRVFTMDKSSFGTENLIDLRSDIIAEMVCVCYMNMEQRQKFKMCFDIDNGEYNQ